MEGQGQQIAVSVPLFLRKLWKMVNDQQAEDVIGWNSTGDGFVIYDQLQFITKLLPKYFKHNNMASFIRQLNFYDFHKVSSIDKDEIQFTHNCFLKDLPETLVFIRRKCTSLRSKLTNNVKDEELSEILCGVKEMKSKHALVDNELKQLKEENAALWNEVNNLRLKHVKQTKIINKIIHFLISYMHSHPNALPKGKVSVATRNNQNLRTGPTILEIGYDNSPDYVQKKAKQNSYTVTEPGPSGAITYTTESDSLSNLPPVENTLDEILDDVDETINSQSHEHLMKVSTVENSGANPLEDFKANMLVNIKPNISNEFLGIQSSQDMESKALEGTKTMLVNIKPNISNELLGIQSSQGMESKALEDTKTSLGLCSSAYKKRQAPIQNATVKYNILQNPKENLGVYLDNTQIELNSLQDMLNNLNSIELANFCNMIEDTEMENSKETSNKDNTDTSIYQELDSEPVDNSEDNLAGNNNEYLNDALVEELAMLPVEPNTMNDTSTRIDLENGQYPVDTEPEVLTDEYFII